MKYAVLVSDKLEPEGLAVLKDQPDIDLTVKTGMTPAELADFIAPFHAIIIRSATKLTENILAKARNLRVIARAGAGVDNVDVPAATRRGIVVMNTPGGNTVSTAEHAIAMLMALARRIYPACASLKGGKWDKKSFTGSELTGKTLGVIGVGRVGSEVAKRAVGLRMKVIAFDPYFDRGRAAEIGVEMLDNLDDLLTRSDYITLHSPLNEKTRGLIGAAQLARVRPGVGIINCARGGIIDEKALAEAITSGKVSGAALDVFENEPPTARTLIDLPQVVCPPHLAASTAEAQLVVAIRAAEQVRDALLSGEVRFALNAPTVEPEEAAKLQPYIHLLEKMGTIASQLCDKPVQEVEVRYSGEAADLRLQPLTTCLTMGLLQPYMEPGDVNMVNAGVLAAERGIRVSETRHPAAKNFLTSVRVVVRAGDESHVVAGTLFGRDRGRIIEIDGFYLESVPVGDMLVILNRDVPGVIGFIGRVLGDHNVNIACLSNGRREAGGQALTIVNVDGVPGPEVLEALGKNENIHGVKLIRLGDGSRDSA